MVKIKLHSHLIMPKKDTRLEELAELLKDDKITQLLVEKLDEMLEKKLDKVVERVLLKLNPILEEKISEHVAVQFDKLQCKHSHLEEENNQLRARLDQMETEARLPNLVFHGLAETDAKHGTKDSSEREATQAVLTLCNSTLGLSLKETDISLAYRMPQKGKEKHRIVIAKFLGMRIRNQIYGARFLLKKTSIYINEHLSPGTAQIYAKVRGLVREGKAFSAWTAGGAVYVRQSEKQGVKPVKILNTAALEKFLHSKDLSISHPEEIEKLVTACN